ncbi:MAG: hypothetical protein NTX84_09765 [Nitrospirae bacterium]|nr:hypothetical protein [Nitrospirota bacterium]
MIKKIFRWLPGGALAVLAIIVAMFLWHAFLLPTSLNEYLFRQRLEEAARSGAKDIRFADLARFDWEEVCFHHPYDGYWRYDKYQRVYHAPARGSQDGIETLLFIRQDGSPTYFVGTAGVHVTSKRRLCWPRNEAIMTRVTDSRGTRYEMRDDLP